MHAKRPGLSSNVHALDVPSDVGARVKIIDEALPIQGNR